MIAFPAGTKVWIAGGVTDMRRGMNTLALTVQQGLGRDPHAGEIFCFRGRKGDLVKLLWHDGVGMSLYLKRLEARKFIWPVSPDGTAVAISAAQMGYLLEGIDWRKPPFIRCGRRLQQQKRCAGDARRRIVFWCVLARQVSAIIVFPIPGFVVALRSCPASGPTPVPPEESRSRYPIE